MFNFYRAMLYQRCMGLRCRRVSVHLSVRLSVSSPSQAGTAPCKQSHTITHELWFADAKNLGEIPTRHPLWGAKQRWGRFNVKLTIFDQHLAISQKWCKIRTQLLWNTNRNSYTLYRMVLFSANLSGIITTLNHPIFDILCLLLYHRSGQRQKLNFGKSVIVASASPRMANHSWKWHGQGHVTHFFDAPMLSLETCSQCGRVVSALGRHVQYSVTCSVAEVRASARARPSTKELFVIIPMHMMNREFTPGM